MTIENYFDRRIRPIIEDTKSTSSKKSLNSNLIDEDQLERTFQEIVNCINLDVDDGDDEDQNQEQYEILKYKNNPFNTGRSFNVHHSLLPEYESIFGGSKGSFNIAVGGGISNIQPTQNTNHHNIHHNSHQNTPSGLGKSFLDDDWMPKSYSKPPGYSSIINNTRPVTPSSSISLASSPPSSSSSSVNNSSAPYRSPFSSCPPPLDYICKLCNCDGHWMKDCKLYEPRVPSSSISSSSYKSINSTSNQGNNVNTNSNNIRTLLPPGNYVCRLCNIAGHWIDECSKFQPKHLIEGISSESGSSSSSLYHHGNHLASSSVSSTSLPPMLGPGPTPNYRPPAYLSKPVPSNYICNLCNRPGHWIQQCTEFTPIINSSSSINKRN